MPFVSWYFVQNVGHGHNYVRVKIASASDAGRCILMNALL
jgi:hypothetical protein